MERGATTMGLLTGTRAMTPAFFMAFPLANAAPLYPEIETYISERIAELGEIPSARTEILTKLAGFVSRKVGSGEPAKMTFICTHNSRRSHMAQIWAQTAARYYAVPLVETFSGGTESTAFNPRAAAAMERTGFRIERRSDSSNPLYHVRSHDDAPVMEVYSKRFRDSPPNPQSGFCAVMTCSQADEACPYVPGAEFRVSIPYEDPQAFDGTGEEAARYDERCRQISREMLFLFSRVDLG